MPIYEFECQSCGEVTERIFNVDTCPKNRKCGKCGRKAKRIISTGPNGTFSDTPKWLQHPEVSGCLQRQADIDTGVEKKIETRGDLAAHLKKHNIVAIG